MHTRTLIFLGDIYRLTADNPSALNCFLQAETLGKQTGSLLLQAWACQHIGDTYFDQRMLDECKSYYRRFYQIAEARHDTLRMAHASQRMGRVYTIESDVDSTIYYYELASVLGKSIGREDFAAYSRSLLADIYIQIEEYGKAAELMEKDTMNMYNWACYFYCQQEMDSAAFYLHKSIGLYSIQVDAECLEMLASIYTDKGDYRRSSEYFAMLHDAEDSLKILSQKEETRRIHAQYNYNSIKQERDNLASKQKANKVLIALIAAVLLIVCVLSYIVTRRLKAQKEQESIKAGIFKREKEDMAEQKERSERKLESIGQELSQARILNTVFAKEKKELSEKLCEAERNLDEAKLERKKLKMEEFRGTRLYRLLTRQCSGQAYKLTDKDWVDLAQAIDDIYDHFTSRLMALTNMSITELRICYLVKLNIPVSDIALLLNKTIGAISHARGRLWKNITGEKESSEKMDNYLRRM